jgi:hypothetical protein
MTGMAHSQPESYSAHCLELHRAAVDLPAKMREVHIDHVCSRIEIVAEHLPEDLGPTDDLSLTAQKELKQAPLPWGERDLTATDVRARGTRVEA